MIVFCEESRSYISEMKYSQVIYTLGKLAPFSLMMSGLYYLVQGRQTSCLSLETQAKKPRSSRVTPNLYSA